MSAVFVPFFFFASVYSQVSLGKTASNAGLYILYFFIGFVIVAQIGGRILDSRGARPAVVMACVLSAVGFYLLARKLTDLSMSAQRPYIIMAGAGMGLMLGTASTDAVNRAPAASYSEVTASPRPPGTSAPRSGWRSWARSSSAATRSTSTGALTKAGVPGGVAHKVASSFGASARRRQRGAASRRRSSTTSSSPSPTRPRRSSTSWPAIMAATFIVTVRWLPRGRVAAVEDEREVTVDPGIYEAR